MAAVSAATCPPFSDDVSVIDDAKTFFSSTAVRAANGDVLIALFNGDGTCVGIFVGSVDATLNLISNVAGCLANGEKPNEAGNA
jgi:hypothetical protein